METLLNNKLTPDAIDLLNKQAYAARKSNAVSAMELAKEAIESAQTINYKNGLAKAYLNAGICSRLTSNFEAALAYYDDSLALYRQLCDKKGMTRVLNSIANVHLNLSDFQKAIEYFDECIYILESIGDIDFEAVVLSNRGLAQQQYGDFDSSLKSYLNSLSLLMGEKKPIPYYLFNNIGIIYLEVGNYYTALKYFNEALKIEEKSATRVEISYTVANIGRTYLYIQDYPNAITYLSEAMITMKDCGDRQGESQVYSNLGKAYVKMRSFSEGIKYLNKAVKYYREIGDRSSVSHTLTELGELYFELNDYMSCKRFFKESLDISMEINDEINEVRTYMGLGKLYSKFLDIETSQIHLEKAAELAKYRKSYKELGRIYKLQYDLFKATGDSDKAKTYLEKHHDALNKLVQMEEDNCIKIFTSYNNFDLKLEAENSADLKKEELYSTAKVA